jgi:predicted O-methyltransferase YrrM
VSAAFEAFEIGAKHIGHGIGVSFNLGGGSTTFRKMLSRRAERRFDQVAGQCTRRFRGLGESLPHEGLDNAASRCPRLSRLGRIAIERRGVIERHAHPSLITFRADESVDQGAQPFERRSLDILKDAALHLGRLPPFVTLEPKEDRRLVWEILIQRSDADAGLLGDPRRREALRAFLRQNLNSSIQNRRYELGRAGLFGLFSPRNLGFSAIGHGRVTNAISKPERLVVFLAWRKDALTQTGTCMTTLTTAPLAPLLDCLFEQDRTASPAMSPAAAALCAEERSRLMQSKTEYLDYYGRLKDLPLAVSRETGVLLYMLARSSRARTIIEFGTSFGVSTLHLAAALRDNGGGRLITTEFEPSKIARAQDNMAAGGLIDLVEIREGDALQTLSADLPETVDLLLLDGAKALYREILSLVESRLRPGAFIVADNADHSPDYLVHVRSPATGYMSTPFAEDVELSMRIS